MIFISITVTTGLFFIFTIVNMKGPNKPFNHKKEQQQQQLKQFLGLWPQTIRTPPINIGMQQDSRASRHL